MPLKDFVWIADRAWRFPELEPFRIPDDINAIAPETLLDNSSTTVSEAIYVQDLNYIFTTAANQAIPNHIEMHKLWIRRRRPSVEDIWESRYPPSGSYQQSSPTSSLRMLLTIEKMLLLTSDEAMIRRLRILQLDYTMFMCLRHGSTGLWNMDRPNHYFPAHEEQFKSLIKTLENDPIPDKPSKSSVIIPAVKRAIFEALRVNADKVVKMDEISGYEDAKNDIKRAIFMATRTPQLTAHGIGSKGILLYGPPGTGKSLLAKSTAALSTKCAVFKASSADLIEKWMGESEQNVAHLFAIAAENAPSIIIIDEIESLCQNRQSTTASDGNARRVATTLLDRMTEHDNVCVLGTTNLPWQLDPAFARRFRRKVHVGLPSLSVRQEMIAQRLRPFNHNLSTADVKTFGQACSGFSGDSVVGSIEVVVEDLAYKIESATHFKRVGMLYQTSTSTW